MSTEPSPHISHEALRCIHTIEAIVRELAVSPATQDAAKRLGDAVVSLREALPPPPAITQHDVPRKAPRGRLW